MDIVLGDPKRLRTRRGHGYLVSWKHRVRVEKASARSVVERILSDPTNVEALRAGLGQPGAPLEELAEWLRTGLSSGAFELLKTRVKSPVIDRAPETNLIDLLPPEEPKRQLDSLTFEVVDNHGEGVDVRYRLYAPSGDTAGALAVGERGRVAELESRAVVEVALSSVVLPLRQETARPSSDEGDDERPAPMGPGETEPHVPYAPPPLGPGGTEPEPSGPGHDAPVPSVVCMRVIGFFFDPEKSFILPAAMDGIRQIVREYAQYPGFSVLAVGHTDTAGSDAYNRDLSLERASNVLAFLHDDASAWLAMYAASVPRSRRWGCLEDLHMLNALGFSGRVQEFQAAQAILADGVIGPQTREKLVAAYMRLDDTTLPEGVVSLAHGCGEHFPSIETGDGKALEDNRRVELFFFDGPIEPPPAAATSTPGSEHYPAWALSASRTVDIRSGTRQDSLRLALYDSDGAPCANTHFAASVEGETTTGTTDANGIAEFPLTAAAPQRLGLAWGGSSPKGPFEHVRELRLSGDPDAPGWVADLSNLGYHCGRDPEEAVLRFQIDEGVDATPFPHGDQPDLPPDTRARLETRSEQLRPK